MQFKQAFGTYDLYFINGECLDYLGSEYLPSLTLITLRISTLSKKDRLHLSNSGGTLHDFVHGVGIEA
jgi:hypothetical protein